MIIGICGCIASGKSSLMRLILAQNPHLFSTSFSAILKAYAQTTDRNTLQNLGAQLIRRKGARGFMKWVQRQGNLPADNLLMDGFRHPRVWQAFCEIYPTAQLIFCSVSRPEQLRRMCARDHLSPAQAKTLLAHPVEQEVMLLKPLADIVTTERTLPQHITNWTHKVATRALLLTTGHTR